MTEFRLEEVEEVKQVPFISFPQPHLLSNTRKSLKDCFLKSSLPADKPHLENILPFIGFDDDSDNSLARVSEKKLPEASDIAGAMVDCPQGFWELARKCANDRCVGFDNTLEIVYIQLDMRQTFETSPRNMTHLMPSSRARCPHCLSC